MKAKLMVLVSLIVTGQSMAQSRLIDKEGTAHFFSEAPLEDIEAKNEQVIGAIDLNKGTLAVTMFMKDFHFEKSLMEEHFNENYIESEKYPRATFSGKLKGFSSLDFSENGTFEASATGDIEMHGVSRPLVTKVKFIVTEYGVSASTKFDLSVADFDIDIPKLVIKNIAEVVQVDATFNFKKQ